MTRKNHLSASGHFKIAYRVQGHVYDVLWLSVSLKRELYVVIPSLKTYKKLRVPLFDMGKVIAENALLDHVTFHNTGRVHWRVKGKEYIAKKDLKTPLFDTPSEEVLGLFAITIPLDHIAKIRPLSKEHDVVFGQVRTEFVTVVCYMAHESNATRFYEEYLKQFNASQVPIFIGTGIQGKVLIAIKTEMMPRDLCDGFASTQLDAALLDTNESTYLGSIATLLPNDYFENYVIPVKKRKSFSKSRLR